MFDDLWERVVPLLPPRPPRRQRYLGRLTGLRCGASFTWVQERGSRDVAAEQVGCSGMTAWRRLRDWADAGVWPQLHEVLLAELRAASLLDMDDAAVGPLARTDPQVGGSQWTLSGGQCSAR
ncbi:hypothetical protein HY68_35965 [Streptomyces sp. AcH 505]|nr:hypothetical protein HY68_35965 [Streptomyces sp. AcH 505]